MPDEQQPRTDLAVVDPPFSNVPATQQSRAVFLPANLAQAMELAMFMSGGIGVRQWMRGNQSACLAVIQISMRWGMDPYIVANKSYYASDTLSFESQLVNAVINTSGELIGRLKVEFSGDAAGGVGKETLNCRVSGRLRADPDQLFVHEQALQTVKIRNSPLWTVNPRQQLQYYTTRAWARLYAPEVLLGIYTPDEIAAGVAQRLEDQSTPRGDVKAPDRRQLDDTFLGSETQAEETDFEEIETVLPEKEESDAFSDENTADSDHQEAENAPEEQHSAQDAGVRSDDQDGTDGAAGVASDGQAGAQSDLADLPIEPLEWAAWKTETLVEIDVLTDRTSFDVLRKRINPALEQADDAILDAIQEALADKLATLPETK